STDSRRDDAAGFRGPSDTRKWRVRAAPLIHKPVALYGSRLVAERFARFRGHGLDIERIRHNVERAGKQVCGPLLWPARTSTRPTARRLATLAPSSSPPASARPGFSRLACAAVSA